MFAASGKAAASCSVTFTSRRCVDSGTSNSYGLDKPFVAVRDTRGIGKKDMKLNDQCPAIVVDPESYTVTADGVPLVCQPAMTVPLGKRYFLF